MDYKKVGVVDLNIYIDCGGVIEEVSQLASILGYRISGSSDNPVITAT
ncbi:hypothetical protein PSMA106859_12655 [Pseudoalteromonas maricaloris]